MLMKCMGGEHRGLEARYTVTSVGGRRAIQMLASDIAEQVEKDYSKPVPVVNLGRTRYQHKSYGRIYTPEFALEKWVGLDEPDSDPHRGGTAPAAIRHTRPGDGGVSPLSRLVVVVAGNTVFPTLVGVFPTTNQKD